MGETKSEIAAHIEETRSDLGSNLQELEQKVKAAVDWKQQFQQHSGTMLSVAFGGGLVIAAMFGSRNNGKILALGAPAALVASLGAEHVIELETDREIPEEILSGLPGVEAIRRDGTTVRLTVRAVHRVVPPLLARLAESRIETRRLATHHATLEDLFITLTGRTLEGGSVASLREAETA